MAETRAEIPLLVAFLDLTRFFSQSKQRSDGDIADMLDGYYERVAHGIERAGGRLVKFIGDGALAVFGEDVVDRGVTGLIELKEAIDRFMAEQGWDSKLTVKAHFGPVIAGPYGGKGAKRYDVNGKAVNTAAALDGSGVTLSVAAFRQLSPELRQRFKKHTPPVTYIRNEDRRT